MSRTGCGSVVDCATENVALGLRGSGRPGEWYYPRLPYPVLRTVYQPTCLSPSLLQLYSVHTYLPTALSPTTDFVREAGSLKILHSGKKTCITIFCLPPCDAGQMTPGPSHYRILPASLDLPRKPLRKDAQLIMISKSKLDGQSHPSPHDMFCRDHTESLLISGVATPRSRTRYSEIRLACSLSPALFGRG